MCVWIPIHILFNYCLNPILSLPCSRFIHSILHRSPFLMFQRNRKTTRIQLNNSVLTRTIPIRIAFARFLLQFLRDAHQNVTFQRAKHQQRAREIATPRIHASLPTAALASAPRRTPNANPPRVSDSSRPPS